MRGLTPLDGVAFAGMFVFGIVMALLGAVIPLLTARLGIGLADVGTLFLVMNAAMLAASLVVGPLIDRFGTKLPLALGIALAGAALAAVAAVSRLGSMLAVVACLGFGGGIVNAGANTLVADLHEDPDAKGAALNLLGVFYGIGALLLPFSVGALLLHVGLAALLIAGAALCLAAALAALALRFPAPKQAQRLPVAEMRRFLGVPLVLALAFLLFFQSGNEFLLGGYIATFLTRVLSMPVSSASYLLAGYWAAIMAARLVLSRGLLARVGAHRTILGGAVLAAAGSLSVSLARTPAVAAAGIGLAALALAGIFPTVLALAGAHFRQHSGTVFGILFTVALTGGMTIPWVAGNLAASAGLRLVFVLAAVNFAVIVALGATVKRMTEGD